MVYLSIPASVFYNCFSQHMCQNRSRLFFRNKYTTTRLRSPINKHLSKIIVFTIRQRIIIRPQTARIKLFAFYTLFTSKIIIMPTDNNTNLGFTPCFWLILRYAHGLYGKVLSRSRALSYSKNTTENLFTTENAEISDDFWKRRTRLYSSYYKRGFFIKALKYRRFGNDIVQSVSVIFHGSFRWFFTIKIIYAPTSTPLPFAPWNPRN